MGSTVSVKVNNGKVTKRPGSVVRKPIPPRQASPKAKPALVAKWANSGTKVHPEKFTEVNCQPLIILPPTFTEKNLRTKTFNSDDKDFSVEIPAEKSMVKISEPSSQDRTQEGTPESK